MFLVLHFPTSLTFSFLRMPYSHSQRSSVGAFPPGLEGSHSTLFKPFSLLNLTHPNRSLLESPFLRESFLSHCLQTQIRLLERFAFLSQLLLLLDTPPCKPSKNKDDFVAHYNYGDQHGAQVPLSWCSRNTF